MSASIMFMTSDLFFSYKQDIFLGTQLLAIDVAAATGLLIRVLTGNELTEKQKQGLRRTLTDLASVVPIGFLMLLPVSSIVYYNYSFWSLFAHIYRVIHFVGPLRRLLQLGMQQCWLLFKDTYHLWSVVI